MHYPHPQMGPPMQNMRMQPNMNPDQRMKMYPHMGPSQQGYMQQNHYMVPNYMPNMQNMQGMQGYGMRQPNMYGRPNPQK